MRVYVLRNEPLFTSHSICTADHESRYGFLRSVEKASWRALEILVTREKDVAAAAPPQ